MSDLSRCSGEERRNRAKLLKRKKRIFGETRIELDRDLRPCGYWYTNSIKLDKAVGLGE